MVHAARVRAVVVKLRSIALRWYYVQIGLSARRGSPCFVIDSRRIASGFAITRSARLRTPLLVARPQWIVYPSGRTLRRSTASGSRSTGRCRRSSRYPAQALASTNDGTSECAFRQFGRRSFEGSAGSLEDRFFNGRAGRESIMIAALLSMTAIPWPIGISSSDLATHGSARPRFQAVDYAYRRWTTGRQNITASGRCCSATTMGRVGLRTFLSSGARRGWIAISAP